VSTDYSQLPTGLPVPEDDGAADHLGGLAVPQIDLPSTRGGMTDLAELARELLVAYVYPRDSLAEFTALGATVVGISAQSPAEQEAFAGREHIPFALLSDLEMRLATELGLPTFEVAGMRLYRRLTFVAEGGLIGKVFYPVFPPDRNAAEVLSWLRDRAS